MANILLSERMDTLLSKAAEALEKGMDPFDNWFLRENDITADECWNMSNAMALMINWFIKQPASTMIKVILEDMDPQIGQITSDIFKQQEIMRRLEELGGG